MKKVIISLSIIIIAIIAFYLYSILTYPTTSPLNVISYFVYSKMHPHVKMKQQTIGFLPYWRLADTQYTRFDLLSEINYFSLSIDQDGNFVKVVDNKTNPGWLQWNSQLVQDLVAKTQITGNTFTLTVAMQKNDLIRSLLDNKTAQKRLIDNIISEIKAKHLNGIIIDFEYDGTPDDRYTQAFTAFSTDLAKTTHAQTSNTTLSMTMMPLAMREKGLFDFAKLVPVYDRFIGMSYDYYGANSVVAGPVAPMNGFAQNKYFFDVTTTYHDYLTVIPKQKLIMGIPYYGWDWAIQNGKQIQSRVLPQDDPNNYAAVISYARAREDKHIKPSQCQWDDYAQEHWCWYIDNNVQHQVWLEDNQSIEKKFTFAKQNNFAGIALWTLGYDKNYPDLWNRMKKMFTER